MRWATAPVNRDERQLVGLCLGELVEQDHPVRYFDELLNELDWSIWEEKYEGNGQPPIHPKLVAGTILYCLTIGARSGRQMEDATRNRTDVQWFLSMRSIDHTTFSVFRKRFSEELKDLSKQLKVVALRRLGGSGNTLAVDGTFIRAKSDRHSSKTAEQLQKAVVAIGNEIESILAEIEELEEKEELKRELNDLRERLARKERELEQTKYALEKGRARDEKKQKKGAVRVPTGDPDAKVQKNKDGGFAPNHHAVIGVDVDSGVVLDEEVLGEEGEAEALQPMVERCSQAFGGPDSVLADGSFSSGENLKALSDTGIEAFIPQKYEGGCRLAERDDPSQPLPSEIVARLSRYGNRFTSEAFLYVPEEDCWYCPTGQALPKYRTMNNSGHNRCVTKVEYKARDCSACPLRSACIQSTKPKATRTISRDEYANLRSDAAKRLKSAEGSATYRRRAPAVEGVFGTIKNAMAIRHFYFRGLEAVRSEWRWICAAYNLKKLLRHATAATRQFYPSQHHSRSLTNLFAFFRTKTRTSSSGSLRLDMSLGTLNWSRLAPGCG